MKKYDTFIGIDVSKLKLDVSVLNAENTAAFAYQRFENTPAGIKQIIRFVKQHSESDSSRWLICLEHTGVYAMPLCVYLSEHQFNFALESAAHILKSIGIKRGKNDKADSKDIARFAYLHHQEIKCYLLPEKQLLKLKLLLAHRERLIRAKKMFDIASGESELYLEKSLTKEVVKDSHSVIKTLERKIKQTDAQINQLIKSDEKIHQACQLATSVPGIGLQTAHHLIVVSRCFTSFENARQLACYAGIAPFEYSSGSSIRGKSRVSHLANKKLKSLLSMGALSAVKHDAELKLYYERKLKEGKNPMLVLNAVRNKILARAFASVKRGSPYVPLMNYTA